MQTYACTRRFHYTCMFPCYVLRSQDLLAERARLQSEVEALRASTAAEASSSKQELTAQRAALEQQQAAFAARLEALSEGAWLGGQVVD